MISFFIKSLLKNNLAILGVGGVLAVGILGGAFVLRGEGLVDSHADASTPSQEDSHVLVETVEKTSDGNAEGVLLSWPGEIMSFGDLVVYPPRDGTIVEWNMRIGQRVSKGQLLGRLSEAPSTIDRSTAIAEQIKDLIRAKSNQPAGARIKEAEVQAAQSERDEANSVVSLRQKRLRAGMEEIFYREVRKLTDTFNPQTSPTLRLKSVLAITNSQTQNDFEPAAQRLRALLQKDGENIPEREMLAFLQIAEKAVQDTIASSQISPEEIADLRDMVGADKEKFATGLSEYKEAVATLQVKESLLAQKVTERDQEAQIAAGEVQATEESYSNVLSSLTNRNIIAPQSGVISSVVKNPGDFVTNDSVVATLTVNAAAERFVRFRIPANEVVPKVGDQLVIVRPGFPLDRKTAKVTGVGTALDTGGSFTAEASFVGSVNWPVHASIRVIPTRTDSIFIPLAAVWWDDDGHSNVWIVNAEGIVSPREIRVGRALGDRVEAVEGFTIGDRYLAVAQEGVKPGDKIENISQPAESKPAEPEEEGGDGHQHDE